MNHNFCDKQEVYLKKDPANCVFWEFSLLRKRKTQKPIKLEHATFDATVSKEGQD